MSTPGTIDGVDVGLAVETTPSGGVFADIGGITTNSMTINNGVIDITNKSSAGWREIHPGQGLQSVDMSVECVFNSEANFLIMEAANLAQSLLNYQYVRGGKTFIGAYKIASWAETSPDNEKLTASISLQSSGEVVVT
tara:strand:- start:418 stop:831 length:414 start_codon:yes stop_codon:yes gene_type:complete